MKIVQNICGFLIVLVITWVLATLVSLVIGFEADPVYIGAYLLASALVWIGLKFAMYLARELEDDY